jgi:lactam utilization protein B
LGLGTPWKSTSTPTGESPEALASGADFELMRYITSANVACGGHAGDENTMRQNALCRPSIRNW